MLYNKYVRDNSVLLSTKDWEDEHVTQPDLADASMEIARLEEMWFVYAYMIHQAIQLRFTLL